MASTLDRYRKRGGFKQLLQLVETSNSKKQASLLQIVESEDQNWAGLLRQRMLTLQKIFQCDGELIEKVVNEFQAEIWVKSLFAIEDINERVQIAQKIIQFMTGPQQKSVLTHLDELSPTPAEIETAGMLLIKKTRQMQADGYIQPEKYDEALAVKDLDEII